MNQKVAAESESNAKPSEDLSHGEPAHILLEGRYEYEFIVLFYPVCMLPTPTPIHALVNYYCISQNHFLITLSIIYLFVFVLHAEHGEDFKFNDERLCRKIGPKLAINSVFLYKVLHISGSKFLFEVHVPTILWLSFF